MGVKKLNPIGNEETIYFDYQEISVNSLIALQIDIILN